MIRKFNLCIQASRRVIVLLDSYQPDSTATKVGLHACLCHSWKEWQKSSGNFLVIKLSESYRWTQYSLYYLFPPLFLLYSFLFQVVIFFFNIYVVLSFFSSVLFGKFLQFFPLFFWQHILLSFIGLFSSEEWVLHMLFSLLSTPAP